MLVRHIYLKIEALRDYSPVAPDDAEHHKYRLDCMRNMGHEDGRIPEAEVDRRRLDALVYREYTDETYTTIKADKLIASDVNEPRAERRIPGAVIYTQPGERLYIHVLNGDVEPHSFHVHGLHYGVDSDGAWPFGVHQDDGNRSDAICPGKSFCYVFDVREDTVGAWPFHDHHMHIEEAVNRGLFGGVIVRDSRRERCDLEVPVFFHRLLGTNDSPLFDSGSLSPGQTFAFTYAAEGSFDYYCRFHPMQGRVRVSTGGPASATVAVLDSPARFEPDDVTIGVGGTVTWMHSGTQPHTVTDRSAAGLESYCINGRTFVGNTPTIEAKAGTKLRWYVFNLDLGTLWHNFHVHGQRWRWGDEYVDTRSLGPAESFVADTVVPPAVLLPLPLECDCEPQVGHPEPEPDPGHGHEGPGGHTGHGARVAVAPGGAQRAGGSPRPHRPGFPPPGFPRPPHRKPPRPKPPHPQPQPGPKEKYALQGDFLFHCHVESHMMHGMVALVRSYQDVELSKEEASDLCFHLPKVRLSHCPDVDHHSCSGDGTDTWETLENSPIFIVHGTLLPSGRVLLFSGAAERAYPLEARLFQPATLSMTPNVIPLPEDFFCSGHTLLRDGRVLVVGGDTNGAGHTNNRAFIFAQGADPDNGSFTATASMAQARWYPTAVRLADGRVLAVSGDGANEVEIFDGSSWTIVAGATRNFSELYPGLHLLPSGEIFYTRAGWASATGQQTGYLTLTGPATGSWTDYGQQQFYDRQEGMSVLLTDTSVSPVRSRLYVFGGGVSGAATARNNATVEYIEFNGAVAGASWARTADMNFGRTNVNVVVLPTGKLLVIGGHSNGQKWSPVPVLPCEIYDPDTDTWTLGASVAFQRQYHSVCILLPDGRVLAAGGVAPGTADPDQHAMELYTPGYLNLGAPPDITIAPATAAFGAGIDVDTPDAVDIASVVLLSPISTTHQTDAQQRYIKLPIVTRTANRIVTRAPANGNIAPPGFYMLFLVNTGGVPSTAHFIQID